MSVSTLTAQKSLVQAVSEKIQAMDCLYDDVIISSQHVSRSGIEYLYVHPGMNGEPVLNQVISIAKVVESDRIIFPQIDCPEGGVSGRSTALSSDEALEAYALMKYNVPQRPALTKILNRSNDPRTIYEVAGEVEDAFARKGLYLHPETQELHSVYELQLPDGSDHQWLGYMDASTGALLQENDLVIHCNWHAPQASQAHSAQCDHDHADVAVPMSYRVYPLGVESPNHGARVLSIDPADDESSPLGWHDDGTTTYTVTRGNNVDAYEDRSAANSPGYQPDGGADLEFDFGIDFAEQPIQSEDAIITNLFYWNNLMHDVWYRYGFDEASGNFQQDNQGQGGQAGDYVRAEAQDGSGRNNANFFTPIDGNRPRMQMFLWDNGDPADLVIITPAAVAGTYDYSTANFGPLIEDPITEDIILAYDNSPDSTVACGAIVNDTEVNGHIALVDRGDCFFERKVVNCEAAGAIAVIICNNIPGDGTFTMGGSDTITDPTIPAIMLSFEDCQAIRMELGNNLNGTIESPPPAFDSDLDAGVICHEYGHGISIRLTGGASTSSCLSNAEQQGEGWSDYWGLVMTQQPGDRHDDARGIGTYLLGQATSGGGIRPARYTTDMAVNGFTYDDIDIVSQPHGVGFVWCSMLWDMTWALDNHCGHSDDIYADTSAAGNVVAYQLVIEGLKLQSCNPGFVDARDAILLADTLLYGGEHSHLIWNTMARRGLGFSADQANADNRSDGAEAFDLPSDVAFLTYDELFTILPDPCAGTDVLVQGIIALDSTISAKNTLTAQSTIVSPSEVALYARDGINLDTGFTVQDGATLELDLKPCRLD